MGTFPCRFQLFYDKWHSFGKWIYLLRVFVMTIYVLLLSIIAAPSILYSRDSTLMLLRTLNTNPAPKVALLVFSCLLLLWELYEIIVQEARQDRTPPEDALVTKHREPLWGRLRATLVKKARDAWRYFVSVWVPLYDRGSHITQVSAICSIIACSTMLSAHSVSTFSQPVVRANLSISSFCGWISLVQELYVEIAVYSVSRRGLLMTAGTLLPPRCALSSRGSG